MPSASMKQARTMAAAAHNPAFAKRVGIPQKVAHDFNQADKGTQLLRQAMTADALRNRKLLPKEPGEPREPRERREEMD
jgi:hypothetical protein